MKVIIGLLYTPLTIMIMSILSGIFMYQKELKENNHDSEKTFEGHYGAIFLVGTIITLALWGIYLAL